MVPPEKEIADRQKEINDRTEDFRKVYRACLADPATDERLDAVAAWSARVSPKGLPVTWVGERVFFGVHKLEELEEAARAAEQRLTGAAR